MTKHALSAVKTGLDAPKTRMGVIAYNQADLNMIVFIKDRAMSADLSYQHIHQAGGQTLQNTLSPTIKSEYSGLANDQSHPTIQGSISCHDVSNDALNQPGYYYGDESVNKEKEPPNCLGRDGFQQALAIAILEIPEREQVVISLYYEGELNLREIGKVLNISEASVSQIGTQALLRLRKRLSEWF